MQTGLSNFQQVAFETYFPNNPQNAFKFDDEVLYCNHTNLEYDKKDYSTHIYFNEVSYAEQKNNFISELLQIEEQLIKQKFELQKEFIQYKNEIIPTKYRKFFRWKRQDKKIEKITSEINKYTSRLGCFVMISNIANISKSQALEYYRDKDKIEKVFDILKNELDSDRLRTQSNTNMKGKLFVQFIALILYSEIAKTMKEKKLYKNYTFREVILELRKIKLTSTKNDKKITSIISKRQNKILDAFEIRNLIKKHGDQKK